MDVLSYKTLHANKNTINKQWHVIDATDLVLGRLSSVVAKVLRGKHKPSFTPHVDCGDMVIVINAERIRLSGKKWTDRKIVRHTGYPGGQRIQSPRELMEKHPTRLVENAIKGMIPRTRLGRQVLKNLFVYAGEKHLHTAQQPKELTL